MCGCACRNETDYTAGYRRGQQDLAWETYIPNLLATAKRVEAEKHHVADARVRSVLADLDRMPPERWHDT
jgi:hypothetical protein